MSQLQLFIPTYRRVRSQTTYNRLPREWQDRCWFVCPKEEKSALLDLYPRANVTVQPSHITTIAAKRQWIMETADSEKVCMLDDDIRLCVRKNGSASGRYADRTNTDVALVQADRFSQALFFQELRKQLDTYAHAGVSMRMGNQSRFPGWHENKRMCYVLAYRRSAMLRYANFAEIAHREDMCVTLRLLRAGLPNSVSYLWAADQVYNKSGGEKAAGRSMEASNKDAEKLAALFPDVVTAKAKAYKDSVPRTEVIVRWTHAFSEHLS